MQAVTYSGSPPRAISYQGRCDKEQATPGFAPVLMVYPFSTGAQSPLQWLGMMAMLHHCGAGSFWGFVAGSA